MARGIGTLVDDISTIGWVATACTADVSATKKDNLTHSLRFSRTLAALAALTLSLGACAGGDSIPSQDPAAGPGTGSVTSEPVGTVTLDGTELDISSIECLQPAVMDGRWRIFISLADGDLTLNEQGSASGVVDGVKWQQSSGDGNTEIAVNDSGATGQTTVYPSGHDALTVDDTAVLEANITC